MRMSYPDTRIEETTDMLTGVSFPDPYRWLEQENDEVGRWQLEQAAIASGHVREWPHFERLRQLVSRFSVGRPELNGGLPRYAAGRWFRIRAAEGSSQLQATVAEEPMGQGRVVFDPRAENSAHPPYLSWISPSPDGHTLALGLCADGSENNTIRLVDVETGRMLADPPSQTLMDNWTGGAQWLADSSGFFFSAIAGTAVEFEQHVFLHRRFPVPTTTPLDTVWTKPQDYRTVVVSRDGRYAVALERLTNLIPVAIATLGEEPLRWRPFITSIQGTVAGHVIGDRYIAITDVGAPRGRLVAIPLDTEDPNDSNSWRELVGESDAVLRTVTPVGDALYLSELVDTYSRVRIMDFEGNALGEVPLPGRGALSELSFPMSTLMPRGYPRKFVFGFSELTVSPGIYSHEPGEVGVEVLQAPQVRLENAVVEDCCAVSADGTRIPYHVVRRADVDAYRHQPTLIYAYGGYNAPLMPQFSGPMAAFVAAGGVYVHAHLRGGGEFGLTWWEGGRQRNKQNGYHDLYAVAENLIGHNQCGPQTLAVMGGSNGGLMAGVALTQRPDLWGVVVSRVPHLDLIGACREPYSRLCVRNEYADIEDPDDVRRLASFSPYHLVRDGVRYPAVFIEAGATDPRCAPWHARKFAARLQRASAGSAPILLHVWENVGHGWATDKTIAVLQHTEWLAFVLRHLGVQESMNSGVSDGK